MDPIDVSQLQYRENLAKKKIEPPVETPEVSSESVVQSEASSLESEPKLSNPQKEQLRAQIRNLFDDHQQITTFFVTNKEQVKGSSDGYYNLTLTRAKIRYERVRGQQKNALDYHLLTGDCFSKGNKLHDDKSQEMLDLFNKISKDIQDGKATVYEKKT